MVVKGEYIILGVCQIENSKYRLIEGKQTMFLGGINIVPTVVLELQYLIV